MPVDELMVLLQKAESQNCEGKSGQPIVTLLDLRTENRLPTVEPVSLIRTKCPTVFCLLDDLQKPAVRESIPKQGLVVTVTETGNRDNFAIQYLSKHGYTNLQGLLYGMRGWLKANYPITTKARIEGP
jgi:rhodanese-related sulfurtransferase